MGCVERKQNIEKWRARRDSNSRPSGFRLRRTLSSRAPKRLQQFLQFLTSLTALQESFSPRRLGSRIVCFTMNQIPGPAILCGFRYPVVMLTQAVAEVRSMAHVQPIRGPAPQNIDVKHNKVARPERFELPTFWFVARRSIQLSYGRAVRSSLA